MRTTVKSKFLLAAPILGLALCSIPASALTPPAMQFSDTLGNVITIDSTGAVTYSTACSTLSDCSATGGTGLVGWTVSLGNFSFGATGLYTVTGGFPYLDMNISGLVTPNTGGGTLTVLTTNTGIASAPVYSLAPSTNWGLGAGNVTYNMYVDPSNTAFNITGTAVLVGSSGSEAGPMNSTQSLSFTSGPQGTSLSWTSQIILTVPADAAYSVDFDAEGYPISATCPSVTLTENTTISTSGGASVYTITPMGGSGSYDYSASGLPTGLSLSTLGPASSTSIIGTPTEAGDYTYEIAITDTADTGSVFGYATCTLSVAASSSPPGMTLTKTAYPTSVAPFQLVTYTYKVTNTGGTTLTNIVVTDDNGTPNDKSDDYTVGTIASLASGASATLTWTTYPTISTVILDNYGKTTTGGTVAIQSIPNHPAGCVLNSTCDLKFVLDQSLALTDNCFGTPSKSTDAGTTACGWENTAAKQNQFLELLSSDEVSWAFYDSKTNLVLQVDEDYISKANAPSGNCPNPNFTSYGSGYGTLGWCGGDGRVLRGESSYVIGEDTSLTDDLNQSSAYYGDTTNSPVPGTSAAATWNFVNSYTIVINPAAFGSNGFGGVAIPHVQNVPSKIETCDLAQTPANSVETNTATATTTGVSVTAQASVTITTTTKPTGPCENSPYPPQCQQPTPPQCPQWQPPQQCTPPPSTQSQCRPSNNPPQVTCPNGKATVGNTYCGQVGTGGGQGQCSYSIVSGNLPPGLKCDSKTGSITGTPTSSGTYNFCVKVTGSNGKSSTANGSITCQQGNSGNSGWGGGNSLGWQ